MVCHLLAFNTWIVRYLSIFHDVFVKRNKKQKKKKTKKKIKMKKIMNISSIQNCELSYWFVWPHSGWWECKISHYIKNENSHAVQQKFYVWTNNNNNNKIWFSSTDFRFVFDLWQNFTLLKMKKDKEEKWQQFEER